MSELPDGWTWARLEDVAEVRGGIQKQGKRRPVKNKYSYLRVANVARGRLDLAEVHEVELFEGELDRYRLEVGDLLVVEGNGSADQIGRAAVWNGSIPECVHQNHLIRVRPSDGLLASYLGLAWNAPLVADYLQTISASTSGLHTLSTGKVKSVLLPMCAPAEQRRIVDILEDHLSRLDAAAAYLTVARRRAAKLNHSVTAHHLSRSQSPALPLGGLLATSIGGVWGSAPGVDSIDVDVLRVTELRPGGRLDPSTAALRSVPISHLASRELQPGDLLLEKSGGGPRQPVGRVGLVTSLHRRSVCSNFMQLMRPDPAVIDCQYLHLYLNDVHARGGTAHLQKASTNIRNIKSSEYMRLEVPVPDLKTQHEIVAAVTGHLTAMRRPFRDIEASVARGKALRSALLAAAFSGRLTGRSSDMDLAEELASAESAP